MTLLYQNAVLGRYIKVLSTASALYRLTIYNIPLILARSRLRPAGAAASSGLRNLKSKFLVKSSLSYWFTEV